MAKISLEIEIGSVLSTFGLKILKSYQPLTENEIQDFNHAHEQCLKAIIDIIKERIGL